MDDEEVDRNRQAQDNAGLICGYLFSRGAEPRSVGLQALPEALAAEDGATFAWLHFNLSNLGARRWLQRQALTPAFHEALDADLRSTRIERDGDALVAVLNDVHFDFRYEPSDFATLWVCLDHRLIVTARQSPLRSVDRLRLAIKGGERIPSTVLLLERLLRAQCGVLVDIVRNVTLAVDGIEDQLLVGRLRIQRAALGAKRRLLVRLQRLLSPEPASLFRLLQHPPEWVGQAEAQELREASEEFSAALQDMALLQERIKLLQEELSALESERTGRSLFVLTVVTVLALPINILAGLFGMNVGGIPLAQHPHGFWIVVTMVLAFTALAGWWVWRRAVRD